jgi:hypothetical protein
MKPLLCKILAVFGCLSVADRSPAQYIVRIEEDWELHVEQPDMQMDAPQITTTLVPFGDAHDVLFQVDVNHATLPSFSSGGLQIRICSADECIASNRLMAGEKLSFQSETLRWTQVVQKSSDGYFFGLINGESSSFGNFGGDATAVFMSNEDAGVVSLNSYSVQDSLGNSGVPYAGNRVAHLRLKKVRIFDSQGQTSEYAVNADVD